MFFRHEPCDRAIAHSIDDLQHQVRGALGPFTLTRQQFQHQLRREAADGRGHIAEGRFQTIGRGLGDDLDNPFQHAHERGGVRFDPPATGTLLEQDHQFSQPFGVACDLEQGADRVLVEVNGIGAADSSR